MEQITKQGHVLDKKYFPEVVVDVKGSMKLSENISCQHEKFSKPNISLSAISQTSACPSVSKNVAISVTN